MPLRHLPRGVLGGSQAVARQHAMVQSAQFLHDQGLHAGALAFGNLLSYGVLNAYQRITLRLRDDDQKRNADQAAAGAVVNQVDISLSKICPRFLAAFGV